MTKAFGDLASDAAEFLRETNACECSLCIEYDLDDEGQDRISLIDWNGHPATRDAAYGILVRADIRAMLLSVAQSVRPEYRDR